MRARSPLAPLIALALFGPLACDSGNEDSKAAKADSKPDAKKTSDAKASDAKAADAKPGDAKPSDAKAGDPTPPKADGKAPADGDAEAPVEGDGKAADAPEKPAREPGALPFDFPPMKTLKAEKGQLALGIDPYRLEDAWKAKDKGEEAFGMSYTDFEFVEVGEFESKVKRVSEATLPNALIIPLPKSDPAKKGDVVFTWWQSGGGLQRALVVGGTETEPEVMYLDLMKDLDDAKKKHTLKPGSFIVLGNELEHGSTVWWEDGSDKRLGQVVAIAEDKLLVLSGAYLRTAPKSAAKVFPAVPDVKKGDTVITSWAGASMTEATVVKVNKKKGKVKIKHDMGEDEVPFGEVMKKPG